MRSRRVSNRLNGRRSPHGLLSAIAFMGAACAGERESEYALADKPYAATGFVGVMLDNDWWELVDPPGVKVEDSYFVGGAVSARIAQPIEDLDIEIEGQIVRHLHGQTHWELNAPIVVARWNAFPWDAHLNTSAAFGIGPSFASEAPHLEVENEGESQAAMVYWMAEVAFDLPADDWEVLTRLHHRSTGFGTFGEDGGANALALGVRRRF